MSKRAGKGHWRHLRMVLTLALATIATGCCLLTPPQADAGEHMPSEIETPGFIPILVTLAAQEGEPLATARARVLARLRTVMSADGLAAIRVYETLPVLAVRATPSVLALLLSLPEVRWVEADRAFLPL